MDWNIPQKVHIPWKNPDYILNCIKVNNIFNNLLFIRSIVFIVLFMFYYHGQSKKFKVNCLPLHTNIKQLELKELSTNCTIKKLAELFLKYTRYGLTQLLASESTLKMMNNAFCFTLKVLFVLEVLVLTFWSCRKTALWER